MFWTPTEQFCSQSVEFVFLVAVFGVLKKPLNRNGWRVVCRSEIWPQLQQPSTARDHGVLKILPEMPGAQTTVLRCWAAAEGLKMRVLEWGVQLGVRLSWGLFRPICGHVLLFFTLVVLWESCRRVKCSFLWEQLGRRACDRCEDRGQTVKPGPNLTELLEIMGHGMESLSLFWNSIGDLGMAQKQTGSFLGRITTLRP